MRLSKIFSIFKEKNTFIIGYLDYLCDVKNKHYA